MGQRLHTTEGKKCSGMDSKLGRGPMQSGKTGCQGAMQAASDVNERVRIRWKMGEASGQRGRRVYVYFLSQPGNLVLRVCKRSEKISLFVRKVV